jgi:hypothetical protein
MQMIQGTEEEDTRMARTKPAKIDHSVPQDRAFTDAIKGRDWILTAPINVGTAPAEMSVYERVWIAAGFTVEDTHPNNFARIRRAKGEPPCLIVPNIEHRIGRHRTDERHTLYVYQRACLFGTVFKEVCEDGPRPEAVALVDAWDRLGQPPFHTGGVDKSPLTVEGVDLVAAWHALVQRRKEGRAA